MLKLKIIPPVEFTEVLVGRITAAFGRPDPLIDRLMGDPIDAHYFPTAANQFRRELLFDQPLAGLGFEGVREPPVFGLIGVTPVGELLGGLRTGVIPGVIIGYIAAKPPTDRRVVYADGPGNLTLVMTSIEQGFNLMTVFYAELGVFTRGNTNITRLAEDLRRIPLRSFFMLHLLLELRFSILSGLSRLAYIPS